MRINGTHFVGVLERFVLIVCKELSPSLTFRRRSKNAISFLLLPFERSLDDPVQPSCLTEEEIGFRKLIALRLLG